MKAKLIVRPKDVFIQYVFINVRQGLCFRLLLLLQDATVVEGLEPVAPSAVAGALLLVTNRMNLCLSGKIFTVQRFTICGAESWWLAS